MATHKFTMSEMQFTDWSTGRRLVLHADREGNVIGAEAFDPVKTSLTRFGKAASSTEVRSLAADSRTKLGEVCIDGQKYAVYQVITAGGQTTYVCEPTGESC